VDSLSPTTTTTTTTTIRVCQNKHCCKKYPNLLQSISNLMEHNANAAQVVVESSGCLSECEKGPNIEILSNSKSNVFNGIDDATIAAVRLELALETPIPKLLIAASKVMERAIQSQGRSTVLTRSVRGNQMLCWHTATFFRVAI
jgi:hypothetical protein